MVASMLGSCHVTEPIEFVEERSRVIETTADSLIIPSYTSLLTAVEELSANVNALAQQPSQSTLSVTQTSWVNALLLWESASLYEFGPAMNTFGSLGTDVATFPASDGKIERAIAAGDTSTQNFDRDKRGFFALEYLLFRDEAGVLHPDSTKRRNYAIAIARHLVTHIRTVRDEWTSGYRNTFVKSPGTDAGSSMSLLFNAMNGSYEQAKNFKIALPAGRRLGQPISPELVEAFYSGKSIIALKRHIRSVFELWNGREPGVHGFRYYLGFVANGERLVNETQLQMDSLNVVLDSFGDDENLSTLITAHDARVDNLVEHSQKMSRFLKSELSSLIGIAITYSSGDGD